MFYIEPKIKYALRKASVRPVKEAEALLRCLLKENTKHENKAISGRAIANMESDTEILKQYHKNYINDILKEIRRGDIDFVYDPVTLMELHYYEPRMDFKILEKGIYTVYVVPNEEEVVI